MVEAFNGGARVKEMELSIAGNCMQLDIFWCSRLSHPIIDTMGVIYCIVSKIILIFGAVMKDTGTVASVQCFHTVPTGYCKLKDCGPKDAVEVIPIGHSRDTTCMV
jgi:hypothetical protein